MQSWQNELELHICRANGRDHPLDLPKDNVYRRLYILQMDRDMAHWAAQSAEAENEKVRAANARLRTQVAKMEQEAKNG